MQPSARYAYADLKPATSSFRADVLAGLSAPQKFLSPKYFYDARGSRLFDAICELPEYYPTRTEIAMLRTYSADMAARVGPGSAIVEYGSGSGRKTRLLIEALRPAAYVAIDISAEPLHAAISELAAAFPSVRMSALCADYTQALPLDQLASAQNARRVVYFPGSTIGNFHTSEALHFLVNARKVAGAGGVMLVGVDLKKAPEVLHAAYNDAQGVTAAFNLNVLYRINRELGADFDVDGFAHRAHYDQDAGRIEMHLVSRRVQQVGIDGVRFDFAAGESIHTESSYKYSVEEFQALADQAGFVPTHCWVDPQRLFSIHYLTTPPAG